MEHHSLTPSQIAKLNTKKGLVALMSKRPYNVFRALRYYDYERNLKKLQIELVRLQTWALKEGERILIVFEGRDAAGKGGAIRRLTERINPRHVRIVALPKPTEEERSQWYFQRYVQHFPTAGEMVIFDRSWYNRAVVEPVNGFCTQAEYESFMNHVNEFEQMIVESGIRLVKIYMSISKTEQAERFEELRNDPLKQWKMTPVDEKAQELWDQYTSYKNKMFANANNGGIPFNIIKANRKTQARISVIKHILKSIPYDKNLEV
ncbi:polyphosphate kinase 2 [Flavobacteriaceae bacterium F08102]|nr:polyphosphate kinase 2 [Flavobacteriaceae bacterium F08102]